MSNKNYTTTLVVPQPQEEVYNAINNVPGWWTTVFEGQSQAVSDVFTVRFGETWITLQVIELTPYSTIRWRVADCNKHWLKDKKEWKDTTIIWELSATDNGTQILFTHVGLAPGMECYNGCEKAWDTYLQKSLSKLITAGKGQPDVK